MSVGGMAITTLNEIPEARSSKLVCRNCCTKRGQTSKSEMPLKPGIKVCLLLANQHFYRRCGG